MALASKEEEVSRRRQRCCRHDACRQSERNQKYITTVLMRHLSAQAAVLGFVGSPWTLATYLIEGGSTPLYKKIKAMTAAAPDVLSALLQHLAVQIAEYMCFQVSDAH